MKTLLFLCTLTLAAAQAAPAQLVARTQGPAAPDTSATAQTLTPIPFPACDGRISVNGLPGSATAVHVITEPGSYVLRRDVIGEPGKNGIEIASDDVTLDLKGFHVRGVPGAISGIATPTQPVGIVVRNGVTSHWGERGVFLDSFGGANRIERVISNNNGFFGFQVGTNTRIVECQARSNSSWGILAGADACVITDCVLQGNGRGIFIGVNAEVANCHINGGETGVEVAFVNSVVRGCNITSTQNGILANQSRVRIFDNHLLNNSTVGIRASGTACLIIGNTIGPVEGAVVPTINTAFDIAPGNVAGPIVDVAGAIDISAVSGADHPQVNLVY